MRLTLRTLLAYLDEILEPADAAEMGKKIQESEFATSLMHRTRDVTRRLRLGAPKLEGRGMGLDPNTVAEYLDNTLPGERVPDFEKVCLESDVHLAEVASAHQILALVLGEPAEFDSRGRERMYALASAAEQAAAPPDNGKAAPAAPKKERPLRKKKRKKRPQPEVPDYLREDAEPSRRGRWLAAAVVLLLLLTGGGALMLRTMAPQAWQRLTGQQVAAVGDEAAAEGVPEKAAEDQPSRSDQAAEASSPDEQTPLEDAMSESEKEQSPSKETEAPASPPKQSDSAESASPPPPAAEEDDAPIPPLPSERPGRKSPSNSDADGKPARKKPAARRTGEIIGRMLSDHDVLLRWDADAEEWRRLPGRESIHAGDRLTALPSYQPSLALGAGVTVQLLGGASVEFDAPDADGAPGIKIHEGRVLLMTVAKPDVYVKIQAGDPQGTASFGRDDAAMAIDVTRELPDGIDPEMQPAIILANLYVTSGEVTWVSPGAGPETMKVPSHRALNDNPREARDAELPGWIKANDLSPIEKRAATALNEHLSAEQSAVQILRELAGDKRWENSLLALRSLALIGEFEPCVTVFNDDAPNRKNAWTPLIESLRAAMLRGPDVAARVRTAFQSERGEENGAALYRMLWGYTSEQLADGADSQLVEYLSHPDLDFRVLSFWNLHHITGWSLSYRPEYTEAKRRLGVAAWRQKLSSGQIAPTEGAE